MIKKRLVSVLMPVYNGLPYIKMSLTALLWQTYDNWECVIVNDGSTDGTKEYLNQLVDSRFRVVDLVQNTGRGNARQVALEHAQGEYIAYLDAGDWCSPKKLEYQIKYLQENPDVALVSAGIYSYGEKKTLRRVRCLGNGQPYHFNKSIDRLFIACAASMIRRNIIASHKYDRSIDYGEDVDFISRCVNGRKYAVLNEVLYYYSEFDSMSIVKLKKAYKEIYNREKNMKTYFKYLCYAYIAPILGIDFFIKRRGKIPTDNQNQTFDNLFKRLELKMDSV